MTSIGPNAVRLARSDGIGAGRFFGRALNDPLSGGCALVGVAALQLGERVALDFLFARDGGRFTEVIRCQFDPTGSPESCEVWHLDQRAPPVELDASELARLLGDDDHIVRLATDPEGLALQTAAGQAVVFRDIGGEVFSEPVK